MFDNEATNKLAQLCNPIKKNVEHIHMHTIFRNFLSQYSRRLLSILAQPVHKQNKKKHSWLLNTGYDVLFMDVQWALLFNELYNDN